MIIRVVIILIFSCACLYCLCAFTECPILKDARNIWVETAMTTADHQWLATKLFPKSVIEKVMQNKIEDTGVIAVTNFVKAEIPEDSAILQDIIKVSELEVEEKVEEENTEQVVNQIVFDDNDEFGNKVVVNDKEQGIKIVEVSTVSYTGKIVFVDDPSRVIVRNTDTKDVRGKLILDYLKDYDAIIGVNANGFLDYDGKGNGGTILGYSISDGEVWGNGDILEYTTLGFDKNDRLVVGRIDDFEEYEIRDGAQFKPALIIDGEILETCKSGWGLQPRTIVAQRADGVVMFLVIDGRQVGYSVGITMLEAAELLLKYGAVTAAACDGGSSSVLAYNDSIINKPSTPMVTGRYLPNAFLVKRR